MAKIQSKKKKKKNSTEEVGWRQKKVDKWRQKRDREKAKEDRRKGENRAWKMRGEKKTKRNEALELKDKTKDGNLQLNPESLEKRRE